MPSRVEAWILGVIFVAVAALFSLCPELDLIVSGLFYTAEQGFAWNEHPLVQAVYWGVKYLSTAIIVVLLVAWLVSLSLRQGWLAQRRRWLGFCMLAITLGPGLITDQLLKNHWHRARPVQVTQFGGDKTFTPALQPTNQCARNCSFVSGHASGGFAQMTWGWLAVASLRRRWLYSAIAAGLLIGVVRIAQGGHFASDVFFAFYAVWLGNLLAWGILRGLHKLPLSTQSQTSHQP